MSKRSPVGGARKRPPTGRAGGRGAPYEHIQRGHMHWTLHLFALGVLALPLLWSGGGSAASEPGAAGAVGEGLNTGVPWLAAGLFAALLEAIAWCIVWLGSFERSDHLLVRFGPIPAFRTRLPYAGITAVEEDTFSFPDGWGLHWRLQRGWCWRVAGKQCVHVTAGRRQLRIGTDDPAGLADVLRARAGV